MQKYFDGSDYALTERQKDQGYVNNKCEVNKVHI